MVGSSAGLCDIATAPRVQQAYCGPFRRDADTLGRRTRAEPLAKQTRLGVPRESGDGRKSLGQASPGRPDCHVPAGRLRRRGDSVASGGGGAIDAGRSALCQTVTEPGTDSVTSVGCDGLREPRHRRRARRPREGRDPVDLARTAIAGLRADDVVERGDPAELGTAVQIVRAGEVIGSLTYVSDGKGAWLLVGGTLCAALGISSSPKPKPTPQATAGSPGAPAALTGATYHDDRWTHGVAPDVTSNAWLGTKRRPTGSASGYMP